jgi:hypothetical protein
MRKVGLDATFLQKIVDCPEHGLKLGGFGVLAANVVARVEGVDQVQLHHRPLQRLQFLRTILFEAIFEGKAEVHGGVIEKSAQACSRHAFDH